MGKLATLAGVKGCPTFTAQTLATITRPTHLKMKNKFTIDKPMPPIWIMYPNISQYSIGWRMGYGEGYKYDLYDWLETLTKEEQEHYSKMFQKPLFWRDFKNINEDDYYFEEVNFWEKYGIPKFSLDKLNANEKYFYFWKPNNDEISCCLGQWQYSEFEVDIDKYFFAEQYMMAEKARLFKDEKAREEILKSRDPKEIKALGRKVKNFNQEIWDKVKYSIVLNSNYYKFSQNEKMREFLLSTENKVLVEASPLDKIWGIGLSKENTTNHLDWKGQNLLGFALMEVRNELKRIYKNYKKINWAEIENE